MIQDLKVRYIELRDFDLMAVEDWKELYIIEAALYNYWETEYSELVDGSAFLFFSLSDGGVIQNFSLHKWKRKYFYW